MSQKYKGKYRRSIRRPGWDYCNDGLYFVTICTKNRVYYFGNVIDCEMHLSGIGRLADKFWNEIPDHFSGVQTDACIIMPDHVHGIIQIGNVGMLHATSLRDCNTGYHAMGKISPRKGSLSAIIRSYKSAVTKHAHLIDPCFAWQPRYYDRVIRNYEEYNRIRQYICDNPSKWLGMLHTSS